MARAHTPGHNDRGQYRQPVEGGRTRTLTIWATEEELTRIDAMAKRIGLSRARFLQECVNAGFRILKQQRSEKKAA